MKRYLGKLAVNRLTMKHPPVFVELLPVIAQEDQQRAIVQAEAPECLR